MTLLNFGKYSRLAVLISFSALVLVLNGCKKDSDVFAPSPGLIENQTFRSTVLIDGHDYDGTIIRNCIFEDIEGDGLQIRDADRLIIENSVFRNITEDAIRFRNSGTSDQVIIRENEIYNIGENGILGWEGHTRTVMQKNRIYNVATDNTSSQFGAPHHGIYWQGPEVEVLENEIFDVINDNGNCISIRSNGFLACNVLYNATDHGISYFSDHPGYRGTLLIENNIVHSVGGRGVNLESNGQVVNHVNSAIIRFNTLVTDDVSTVKVDDDLSGMAVDFIGNIAIRTDGNTPFVFTNLAYTDQQNITASGDQGFVDFANRNLHITASSVANGFADGISVFPDIDFEGDSRLGIQLDAGADQFN